MKNKIVFVDMSIKEVNLLFWFFLVIFRFSGFSELEIEIFGCITYSMSRIFQNLDSITTHINHPRKDDKLHWKNYDDSCSGQKSLINYLP